MAHLEQGETTRTDPWIRFAWHYFIVGVVLAGAVSAIALYPLATSPSSDLTRTLAGILAGTISFASLSFSGSRAMPADSLVTKELRVAGLALLRVSVGLAAALAVAVARVRFRESMGNQPTLNLALRLAMLGIVGFSGGGALFAFRQLLAHTKPDRGDIDSIGPKRMADGRPANVGP